MTTIKQINKALALHGISGQIVRGKGYFYFIGDLFDKVPSIYQNNLLGWSIEQIIKYVKDEVAKSLGNA